LKRWLPLLVVPLILGALLFYPVTVTTTNSGLGSNVIETLHLTAIYHSVSPNLQNTLLAEGYNATCDNGLSFGGPTEHGALCAHGWTYMQDPTVHLTNQGIDCIQFKIHGQNHASTCSVSSKSSAGNQNVTYTYVSVSGGATPSYTETACPATIQTSDGYSVATVTPVAGTPSSGSATLTITKTWTDATAQVASIDLACIGWSSTTAGSLYADGQIGSTTTNIGDTLETIWSITYATS
jgi:hypothetical protein